jgi:hypothetical protein
LNYRRIKLKASEVKNGDLIDVHDLWVTTPYGKRGPPDTWHTVRSVVINDNHTVIHFSKDSLSFDNGNNTELDVIQPIRIGTPSK